MELKVVLGNSLHTNCYILVEGDEALIIDYVPEVYEFLQSRKLKAKSLLLTHIHYDHIEGLEELLQDLPELSVYMSEEAKREINNPQYTLNFEYPYQIDTNRLTVLQDGESVFFAENKITMMKSPGHSIDGVVYYVEALKSLFCGDSIFFRSIGRTDFPGASYEILMNSIKSIFAKYPDDTLLYPGHGPNSTISSEKKNNSFIRSFT